VDPIAGGPFGPLVDGDEERITLAVAAIGPLPPDASTEHRRERNRVDDGQHPLQHYVRQRPARAVPSLPGVTWTVGQSLTEKRNAIPG
jgi:hypothetical protein